MLKSYRILTLLQRSGTEAPEEAGPTGVRGCLPSPLAVRMSLHCSIRGKVVLRHGGHVLKLIPLESEHLVLHYDVRKVLRSLDAPVRCASTPKFRRTFQVWKVVTLV